MEQLREYTDEEISALAYYSSRKRNKDFFALDYGYKNVNSFLRYLSRDGDRDKRIPIAIRDVEEFKKFLKNIVSLYTLSCKYGLYHNPPSKVFRGDNEASNIVRNSYEDVYGVRKWDTDSFLSCSMSLSETDIFSGSDGPKIEVSVNNSEDKLDDRIPFIDVNAILGSSQFYGDEKEILFPPFLKTNIESISQLYYKIVMTSICTGFDDEEIDIDDDFLRAFLELSKKASVDSTEDSRMLESYRVYLKKYLQNKLSMVNFITSRVAAGFFDYDDYISFMEKEFAALSSIQGEKKI